MKNIENGFMSYYYLAENGKVYNSKTNKYLKLYNNMYSLRTETGETKRITLKDLYKLVYNKVYCIDDIEDLQGEKWEVIPFTNERYYASNKGRIKSYMKYKATLLSQHENEKCYLKSFMVLNDKEGLYYVHRLIALTFLDIPKGDIRNYQVHHKDGNTKNNNIENLEWLTIEEHYKKHNKEMLKNDDNRKI